MPTEFPDVVNDEVIEPEHVNRYSPAVNDLEKFREGTLPNLGDQDLGDNYLVNVSRGGSTEPSISFFQDEDTGIFSPGPDEVGVATGGQERARFDSQGATVSGFKMASGAGSGKVLTSDANGVGTWQAMTPGVTDHGQLTGLADDDHAQYVAGQGRSGGQSLNGGTAAGEHLTLSSTTNATKGKVVFGGNSAYDEANVRLGVGTTAPTEALEVQGVAKLNGVKIATGAGSGKVLTSDANGSGTWQDPPQGVTDHGQLTGLADDDHAQYVMKDGRSGGQTVNGGTASSENLTLSSTTNATKGKILLGGASAYDHANERLGVGTTTPAEKLEVNGTVAATGFKMATGAASGKVLTSDANGAGTWQDAAAGTVITELWKFSKGSDQTIEDAWEDVTSASKTNVSFGGGTVIFFVNVTFEAVSAKPTRKGQFRLHINTGTTTYVPSSTGFDFITPYQLDETGTASHVFVLTNALSGSYTVKLQAKMDTNEQCKIGQYNYLSCAMIEV